jgi:hypothetical protein
VESLLRCPICDHGAGFHLDEGRCRPLGIACDCTANVAQICESVLTSDREQREAHYARTEGARSRRHTPYSVLRAQMLEAEG